ncbi:MAG: MFS transporter [Gammaproteobacteria bacterium]
MFATLRTLPATVWLLSCISLLNDTASDMVYPLVPLYLSAVLMAGPKALGLIEGIAEATGSLLKLFSGVAMDRTRYAKPWIVFGYGLAGFSRPLLTLASSWIGVLFIRFADRVGKGLRTSPRDALLAASVAPGQRGLAFGVHRAMDNAGAVLGPLIAALLIAIGYAVKDLFLFAVIPAVICLALAMLIKEPQQALNAVGKSAFSWSLADMPAVYKRYLAVVALFTLGNSSNMFLLLRARELGLSEAEVPLVWALVSAIAMLFSTPLSALSDRFGRVRCIVGGWLAYGLFYIGLGLLHPHTPLMLFGLFAFYGLFAAATEGVEKALVADLAPPKLIGTAFGWFNLVTGAMLLPASLVFGGIYQQAGAGAAFGFSAVCAFAANGLLLLWVRIPAVLH